MRNICVLLITLFGSFSALAQDDLYFPEELYFTAVYNEYTYPVLIPYQDEQAALSFKPANSIYCLNLTKDFSQKSASLIRWTSKKGESAPATASAVFTQVEIPERWAGREKIIAFSPQSVSCMLVVNGKKVAFIEKELPLQFNITSLLSEKNNRIELQFTGSYPKNSLNTILLVSQPPVHLIDIDIEQWFNYLPTKDLGWYENFILKNYAIDTFFYNYTYTSKFYDRERNLVKLIKDKNHDYKPLIKGKTHSFGTGFSQGDFKTWTCETPNLYLYTQQVIAPDKQTVEILSKKAGFRVAAIRNNKLALGNPPYSAAIHLKPVHYTLPLSFDSLHSIDMLREDLVALKKHNVNTIILSGYPTGSAIYDLCDELGLYVIQQIQLPAFESLGKLTLDEKADIWRKQSTKVAATVAHLKDHPSFIALYVDNPYSSIQNPQAFIESIYYYGSDMLVAFQDRIFFKTGTQYNMKFPVDWYKLPQWQHLGKSQKDSLQKLYQYADFWVKTGTDNKIHLTNLYDFSGLDHLQLQWQITENGKITQQGQINELAALPKKSMEVPLPFSFTTFKDNQNIVFRFSLHLKEKTNWAEQNQETAWEEFFFAHSTQGVYLVKKTQ